MQTTQQVVVGLVLSKILSKKMFWIIMQIRILRGRLMVIKQQNFEMKLGIILNILSNPITNFI
jgi:hypothetical protein